MNRFLRRSLIVVAACSAVVIAVSAFALARTGSKARAGAQDAPSAQAIASPLAVSTAFSNLSTLAASLPVTVDAHTAALVSEWNLRGALPGQDLSQARLFNFGVDGKQLYAIPTDDGSLCVFLVQAMETCGGPLTSSDPALFNVFDRDSSDDVGPTIFGVAMDGVQSMSFDLNGQSLTIPVKGNVFSFDGPSTADMSAFTSPRATFGDGRTVPLPQ